MGSDLEKHQEVNDILYENSTGAVLGESFEYGDTVYAKLQRLAGRFHIEQRGIERVPEIERTDTSYSNIGTMVRLLSNFLDTCGVQCDVQAALITKPSGWRRIWL
jgi:hypothetical protein